MSRDTELAEAGFALLVGGHPPFWYLVDMLLSQRQGVWMFVLIEAERTCRFAIPPVQPHKWLTLSSKSRCVVVANLAWEAQRKALHANSTLRSIAWPII